MSAESALADRVDRLERVGLAVLGVAAVGALLIGGFLPWYTAEITDDGERTERLFTLGFQLFTAPSETSGGASGVLLVLCFLFLDLVTAVTVVTLVQIVARAWRWVRFGRVLGWLLIMCWVGALLITGMAAGVARTDVHGASVVVFGVGVLLTALLVLSRALQEWWLPR